MPEEWENIGLKILVIYVPTIKQDQSLILGDSFILQTCIYVFKQDESTCDIGVSVMSADRNSGQTNPNNKLRTLKKLCGLYELCR